MKKRVFIVLLVCLVFLAAACSSSTETADASQSQEVSSEQTDGDESSVESAAASETVNESESAEETEGSQETIELTIAAAASLTDVTVDIAEAYKEYAPNVELVFTYASSGNLQTQIEEGVPVDMFISAAQKQMNALEEEGLLADDTRSNLLQNEVVLIMPSNSDMLLTSFDDLATDTVSSVAMGDPESVPAGQYAQEVLTSLDIWDTVEEKANYGSDVRQVLTWVESDNVDCGIVYATDAATSDDVLVVCEAPEGSVEDIIYPVSVLEQSELKEAAVEFIDFMKTDDAAAIFEEYGFKMAGDA